jgi:hypothetical protein
LLIFLVLVATTFLLVRFELTGYVFGGELAHSFVELARTSTCYTLTVGLTLFSAFLNSTFTHLFNKFFFINTSNNTGELNTNAVSVDNNVDFSYAVQLKSVNCGNTAKHVEELFSSSQPNTQTLPVNLLYKISDFTLTTSPSSNKFTGQFVESGDFNTTGFMDNK